MKRVLLGMLSHAKTQLDNGRTPHQSCSYTSLAMCLSYYGVRPEGVWYQLEDEMSYFAEVEMGWTRGCPHAMERLINDYYGQHAEKTPAGVEDEFHEYGSLELIKDNINKGYPCVIQGDFTKSGHVICVIGYDDLAYSGAGAYLVLDPYGECNLGSQSYEGMPTSPGPYEYSYSGVERLCRYPDGSFWVHVIKPITNTSKNNEQRTVSGTTKAAA